MGISQQIGASSLIKPGVCTSTTRPASPYQGQIIYETDTNLQYLWNGSSWGAPSVATVSAATNTTQIATTAFVTTADNLKANIASPTFTGNVSLSNGQIITPSQYCYNGDNTGGVAISYSGTPVIPPTTYFNIGSAFNTSNGRFTVPIAGYVLCSFNSLITRNLNASHAYVHFAVDGVRKSVVTHTVYDLGGNYQSLNNTAIVYCPANSYVTAVFTTPQASAYGGEYGLGLTFRYLG